MRLNASETHTQTRQNQLHWLFVNDFTCVRRHHAFNIIKFNLEMARGGGVEERWKRGTWYGNVTLVRRRGPTPVGHAFEQGSAPV